jgi:serine/threonine-protein kinase RsbW
VVALMPREPLVLKVPNRTETLRGVLDRAETYCLEEGMPSAIAREVRLAIEEILANLIAHAWPDGGPHFAELSLRASNGELFCEITDDGIAFDPVAGHLPPKHSSLDQQPIGGLGLVIVRRFADRLAYSRNLGFNRMRFWKSFAPERSNS